MSLFKDQVELQRKKRDGLGRCPQQREPVLGIPLWDPWALKKKSQGTITIPFFFTLSLLFSWLGYKGMLWCQTSLYLLIYLFEHLGATRPLRSFGRVSQEFWPSNTRLNYPGCFFHQRWFSLALNEGLHYRCVLTQTAPPKGHASKFINLN